MTGSDAPDAPAITRLLVLVTAAEAYPVFERCCLNATTGTWMSFRIFDLRTRLRSPEAQRIGKTLVNLVAHTLRRGVVVHVVLADFDPVAATHLPAGTWRSMRQFVSLAECASADRLDRDSGPAPGQGRFLATPSGPCPSAAAS